MKSIITEERIHLCTEDRERTRSTGFENVASVLGEDAAAEFAELYRLYDERFYIWLSSLWQPEIGGMYWCTSGRDTEGMLPNIESTVQAIRCAGKSGLLSAAKDSEKHANIYDKIKQNIVKYAKSLQDPEDGYFYQPQWGKDITTSRRGRDLGWATSILKDYGATPNYPTALDRLASKDKEDETGLPEYLLSVEKFNEYLDTFDLETRSYWSGNMLQSQRPQIEAAGEEFVRALFDSLNRRQRADNGLWEPQINYASVNGLMKLTLMYSAFGEPLPNAVAALNSTIDAALSDEEITFVCQYYNPLITIANILDNIKNGGDAETSDRLREVIKNRAAELIKKTREKVSLCKKPDGAFGYKVVGGICHAQGAPIALGVNESDVDASSISISGVLYNLARVFDIEQVAVFGIEDSKLFFELMNEAQVHPKINPKPDFMK